MDFASEDRYRKKSADKLLRLARAILTPLHLSATQCSLPELQKRFYALKILLEALVMIVSSRAANTRIKQVLAEILQAFLKAALPHEKPPPAAGDLLPDASVLLKYRFSGPKFRRIEASVISQMAGSPTDEIQRAAHQAFAQATIEATTEAIRKGNDTTRIALRKVWSVLLTPLEERSADWPQKVLVCALKALVSVISVRSTFEQIERTLDEWRHGMEIQIVDALLGLTLPGETLTNDQFDTIAVWLDDIRLGQVMGEQLTIRNVQKDIQVALRCLEPDVTDEPGTALNLDE